MHANLNEPCKPKISHYSRLFSQSAIKSQSKTSRRSLFIAVFVFDTFLIKMQKRQVFFYKHQITIKLHYIKIHCIIKTQHFMLNHIRTMDFYVTKYLESIETDSF